MHENHYVFKLPEGDPEKTTIWRYINFSKFVDLISTQSLYLAPVSSMADEHEGIIPGEFAESWIETSRIKEGENAALGVKTLVESLTYYKNSTFISCWSIAPHESYALWRLYTNDKKAIAIKSTVQKLIDAIAQDPAHQYIGEVRYHDGKNYTFRNGFDPIMFKWEYYRFESELRIVMATHKPPTPSHLRVKIDIEKLINQVYLHPHAKNDEFEVIRKLLEEYNLTKEIFTSGIREKWV